MAVLGRAKRLLTSFDARLGEVLVTALNLRGRFTWRDLAGAAIGTVDASHRMSVSPDGEEATIWDFAARSLIGCAPRTTVEAAA